MIRCVMYARARHPGGHAGPRAMTPAGPMLRITKQGPSGLSSALKARPGPRSTGTSHEPPPPSAALRCHRTGCAPPGRLGHPDPPRPGPTARDGHPRRNHPRPDHHPGRDPCRPRRRRWQPRHRPRHPPGQLEPHLTAAESAWGALHGTFRDLTGPAHGPTNADLRAAGGQLIQALCALVLDATAVADPATPSPRAPTCPKRSAP